MLLAFSQLKHFQPIEKVVIHSIDLSLYQASIEVDGKNFYMTDDKGEMVRAFNIIDLQKKFRGIDYRTMVLRHESAYDEMIGQAEKSPGQNMLEVPLKDNDYG